MRLNVVATGSRLRRKPRGFANIASALLCRRSLAATTATTGALSKLGLTVAVLLGSILVWEARARAQPSPEVVRIGSKRFTESYILAEIAAKVAAGTGATAAHTQGLGGTALVFRALQEGSIDVYPEYTGTLAEAVLHIAPPTNLAGYREALEPLGIAMTDPLGFDDSYGLAVPSSVATERHLATISDAAASGGLRFGFSPEFAGRSDGFPGLAARYGIPLGWAHEIDHGLAYAALANHSIDGTDVYSTDAAIARYGLTVLTDDKRFFPSYQAVFLYRIEAVRRMPKVISAIASLSGTIHTDTMIALNARAEIGHETFASIADDFVRQGQGKSALAPRRRPSLLAGTVLTIRTEGPRHAMLVAIALLIAILLGIPLGIVATKARALGAAVLGAASLVQTVPSLALLCFFVPLLGTGILPALVALSLYAVLPIARNTYAGLEGIAPSLRESADALGLPTMARLLRIDLPLASPMILAGARTSAVISVGTATLAAFIGAGGFGAPISAGLNLNDTDLILEGAIPAALFALAVEALFTLLDRAIVPRGLRPPSRFSESKV